jgi:hypothetical protein
VLLLVLKELQVPKEFKGLKELKVLLLELKVL